MITPQEVADSLNETGYDTKEKFLGFIQAASPSIRRQILLARIAKARDDAIVAQNETNANVQALQAQLSALDAEFNQSFGA